MPIKYLKNQTIICVDCGRKREKLTPNHIRCEDCAYKKKKERAAEYVKNHPEENRQRSRDWYWRNKR